MSRCSLSHLSDPALRHALKTKAGCERTATADLVAHIAEYDARRLYLPDGYSSTHAYCVGELHMCEQAAFKRIAAARAARRFPAIVDALADGRLHLSAVVLLVPHLTEHNAKDLLAAATLKTKSEVERMLAERFPRSETLAWVASIQEAPLPGSDHQNSPAHHEPQLSPGIVDEPSTPGPTVPQHAPAHVGRSRVKPLSGESFEVQFTIGKWAHDKLRYVQELLSHSVPSGEVAEVFERALDALIPQLEKARFSAADKPRRGQPRVSENPRHIPAHVMEAVWKRDGGQCTFVSESGHRCEERKFVQFDHILEVARGGESTVDNLRLRCRAHNQYGAEQTFGAEFMRHKQIAAAGARASGRAAAATGGRAGSAKNPIPLAPHVEEVVPYLRQLRYKERDARSAAALCEDMAGASLEDRVRAALKYFRVRGTRLVPSHVLASAG